MQKVVLKCYSPSEIHCYVQLHTVCYLENWLLVPTFDLHHHLSNQKEKVRHFSQFILRASGPLLQ